MPDRVDTGDRVGILCLLSKLVRTRAGRVCELERSSRSKVKKKDFASVQFSSVRLPDRIVVFTFSSVRGTGATN